jgi:transposase-like protein
VAADFVAEATAKIEERLRELGTERQVAERALAGLEGARTGRPSTPPPTSARKRRRKRAPRGQRREQFIAAVGEKPGSTVAQIAKKIGTVPNPFYALARQLVKDGLIEQDGSGYRMTKEPEPKKPTRAKKAGKAKGSGKAGQGGKARKASKAASVKTKKPGKATKARKKRGAKS